MSEHKITKNDSESLIICFGGMSLQIGGILPFEFLNYLSKVYTTKVDLYFYIDKEQCWYHKGIHGITTNIDDTVSYLNNIINQKSYKKVIFMGISAGGYASILFGSLCNVSNVISFIPRTTAENKMTDSRYFNLKDVLNSETDYVLYGDLSETDKNSNHHISQCNNLNGFHNVKIVTCPKLNIKTLRDNGTIRQQIDDILFCK